MQIHTLLFSETMEMGNHEWSVFQQGVDTVSVGSIPQHSPPHKCVPDE